MWMISALVIREKLFFGIWIVSNPSANHFWDMAAQSIVSHSARMGISWLLEVKLTSSFGMWKPFNPLVNHLYLQIFMAVQVLPLVRDGKTLAAGHWFTVTLWNVETQQVIGQPLSGHDDLVLSVAYAPDGKTLASGSTDRTIILWDVETGQPIGKPLSGHSGGVNSVGFSPDGKTLASGSDDNTVILWDFRNTAAPRSVLFRTWRYCEWGCLQSGWNDLCFRK